MCPWEGPQPFELTIWSRGHSSEQLHKHKHHVLMVWAAEKGQGVLGITKLIWGQTGDTCAPKECRGLRIHAALMRGGRCRSDSTWITRSLSYFIPYRSPALSSRAPPLHCWVHLATFHSCAVGHVLVHLGRWTCTGDTNLISIISKHSRSVTDKAQYWKRTVHPVISGVLSNLQFFFMTSRQ